MSVSSTINRVAYIGDGVTVNFPTTFPFFKAADIVVIETTIATGAQVQKVLGSDYTVTGGGAVLTNGVSSPSTGTVVATVAPLNTVQWTIYRDPALTQLVTHVDGDNLPAASIDNPMDLLTLIAQRSREISARTLRQPDGDTSTMAALPAKVVRASTFLAFDATGNPIASLGGPSGTPVSSAMVPVVDAATVAAARTALGSGSIGDSLFTSTTAATARTAIGAMPSISVIKDYGATGNGTTDDTTALQNAITAALAAGVPLFIPAGTYKITAPLTINSVNGLRIVGDQVSKTILKASGNFAAIFSIGASAAEIRTEHLTLDTSGTTTLCVTLANGSQVIKFVGCKFNGDLNGNLVYSQCSGFLEFFDCNFSCNSANTNGIQFDGFNQNSEVTKCRAGGLGTFIIVTGAANPNNVQGLRIENNCSICTGATAIRVGPNAYLTQILGNVLDQAGTHVVQIDSAAALTQIEGNWLGLKAASTGSCLFLDGSAGLGHQVIGNTFFGGNNNILIGASVSARTGNISIIGNIFQSAAVCTVSMDSVNGCTIKENVDLSTPSSGSYATAATNASHGSYVFGNNKWSATAPNPFDTSSSYKADVDSGVTLKARGLASAGSGSSVTVNHGLVTTPDNIKVTPLSGGIGNFNLNAIGATTFQIVWGIAGAASWHWEAEVSR